MRIFEIVKENVNLREAAELYGIDVNRYGKALCPFHNDRHPSLYVADDHYYCFACGEHGDVIDFVGKLFQLSPYDAARKLMADFHLSPDKPPSAAALHAKRIRTEAQQLMENERLCFSVLSDYARVLRDWKVRYAPQSPDAPVHARFMEACHKLDETEYYMDANEVIVRLTREDFASEEEFLKWKSWPDGNYCTEDNQDVVEGKHNTSIDDLSEAAFSIPAIDVVMDRKHEKAERRRVASAMVSQIRDKLTETQFRRLWMYYVGGMTVDEIGRIEGIWSSTL